MPSPAYERAIRATSPGEVVLLALEIRHPALPEPVRVVNAAADPEVLAKTYRIEGETYAALRFEARLAGDEPGQAPRAELVMDNVGRELLTWVEAADGGVGATVRVMMALMDEQADDARVEWEVTYDVLQVRADQERLAVGLGYDPLLDRPAVLLRHDPQTSPGLF